jgi:hypothetical protein
VAPRDGSEEARLPIEARLIRRIDQREQSILATIDQCEQRILATIDRCEQTILATMDAHFRRAMVWIGLLYLAMVGNIIKDFLR